MSGAIDPTNPFSPHKSYNQSGIHKSPRWEYQLTITEVTAKALRAAEQNKPILWAYFTEVEKFLREWFSDSKDDGGFAGAALALSQRAESDCPNLPPHDSALLWAASVYARRILAAWNVPKPKVSLRWLRERAKQSV